ncbi:MAG TPA: cupin domain-containing protein [Kineosporiaceae bacterium]|nr:cupin domain-containing protein [Kineosporiaceae bacterium]
MSDGEPPISDKYAHTAGFARSLVWRTGAPPAPVNETVATNAASYVPGPGETIALTVTFPPDAVFADPSWDPIQAVGENFAMTPGLAELFEPHAPGMHTSPTVDYVVVLDGKLVLDLDNGQAVELNPGDIVVQNSTRHAWRNPGDKPVTIFVSLMGVRL